MVAISIIAFFIGLGLCVLAIVAGANHPTGGGRELVGMFMSGVVIMAGGVLIGAIMLAMWIFG